MNRPHPFIHYTIRLGLCMIAAIVLLLAVRITPDNSNAHHVGVQTAQTSIPSFHYPYERIAQETPAMLACAVLLVISSAIVFPVKPSRR
jgi:MFS superfamily sulfate permease-like transporter